MPLRSLRRPSHRIAALLCSVLAVACAPDRIPGSAVAQGDAGIAFRAELSRPMGPVTLSRGFAAASNSGASYGGGSSSSALNRAALAADVPDLRPGGKSCDAFAAAGPAATPAIGAPWERSKGVGLDGWFTANCVLGED